MDNNKNFMQLKFINRIPGYCVFLLYVISKRALKKIFTSNILLLLVTPYSSTIYTNMYMYIKHRIKTKTFIYLFYYHKLTKLNL